MTITVMSPYSKEYKAVVNELTNDRLKKASREKVDRVEEYDDFALELLARTTVDWNITWDGKKPKFNKELAKTIYDQAFWIKVLVSEAQSKLVDFTIP